MGRSFVCRKKCLFVHGRCFCADAILVLHDCSNPISCAQYRRVVCTAPVLLPLPCIAVLFLMEMRSPQWSHARPHPLALSLIPASGELAISSQTADICLTASGIHFLLNSMGEDCTKEHPTCKTLQLRLWL